MTQNNDDQMQSTMREIEELDLQKPQGNKRENLENDITNLEKDIEDAEQEVKRSNEEEYSHTPVSPEQANERKRKIVFQKKDLDNLKTEYQKLDE